MWMYRKRSSDREKGDERRVNLGLIAGEAQRFLGMEHGTTYSVDINGEKFTVATDMA